MSFANVPVGSRAPEIVNAIIEIPRGSNFKYEYDERYDLIRLDRVLHTPLFYPVDYGFIPQTCSPDGDPLDVLVVVMGPSFPGCLMEVRPLGLLQMVDEKGEDYKILGVPAGEPRYSDVAHLDDLSAHVLREIQYFFQVYKVLEEKQVEVYGWHGRDEAYAEIRRAMAAFRESG